MPEADSRMSATGTNEAGGGDEGEMNKSSKSCFCSSEPSLEQQMHVLLRHRSSRFTLSCHGEIDDSSASHHEKKKNRRTGGVADNDISNAVQKAREALSLWAA